MLPLIVRPALLELPARCRAQPAVNEWVGSCSSSRRCRRHLRSARRLPDRPARPPARADVEHPDLRLLGVRVRLLDVDPNAARSGAAATFVGVCVEFVAAVAWLAELFPDPKQRETVLGYTQAFWSLGGILVAPSTASAYLRGEPPAIALSAGRAAIRTRRGATR